MDEVKADVGIEFSSRVVRSEAIDFTEIDDTVVMMDVNEGRYYELNPVGARVWALIEFGPQVEEVCEALAAEYDVAPDTCREVVRAFLVKLSRLAVVGVRRSDETPQRSGGFPPGTEHNRRRGNPPNTKAAWSTPAIRFMEIERTASGPREGNKYTGEDAYYFIPS